MVDLPPDLNQLTQQRTQLLQAFNRMKQRPENWNPLLAPIDELDRKIATWAARDNKWHFAVLNYFCLAPLADCFANAPFKTRQKCRIGVLTHDICSESYPSSAAVDNRFLWELTPQQEADYLGHADFLIAINKRDAVGLAKLAPEADIVTAMHCQPQPALKLPSFPLEFPQLLFVGSRYKPNIDAMHWFIDKVLPLVESRVDKLQVKVIGAVSRQLSDVPASVELCGYVPNLEKHYAQATLVVVPLQSGSGLKIKLVEALAYGKALVSTSIGLQGIEFLSDYGLQPYDSLQSFADEICRLIEDRDYRQSLEAGARAAHQRYFVPESAHAELRAYLLKAMEE